MNTLKISILIAILCGACKTEPLTPLTDTQEIMDSIYDKGFEDGFLAGLKIDTLLSLPQEQQDRIVADWQRVLDSVKESEKTSQ